MFKTVGQAIEWVQNRRKSNCGFGDFKAYLASKGNPQLSLKCLHVAGTNGKGSTTNYLRSILQNAGYKVGSFTSPHLVTHLDRIRINDQNIDPSFFLETVNQYKDEFEEIGLAMFDIDMFISILYFIKENVDYVVYEVGLGGRLDATNTIYPLVSVITNIEMDHMAILGDTYEKIAFEKAGIIKDERAIITLEKKEECLNVFKKQCQLHHSKLIQTKPIFNLKVNKQLEFDYQDMHVVLPTLAKYQALNASLAIETCLYLNENNIINISKEDILKGLNTFWKGRFEVVSNNPLIIIDGAHNENGIMALCDSIKEIKEDKVIIFSALKDKEYSKMIDLLLPLGEVIITHFENYRGTSAFDLAKGKDVKVIEDYQKAIEYGLSTKKAMIITGSLYFISIIEEYFAR